MEFEWDSNKNQRNVAMHGIDFNDAKSAFHSNVLNKVDARKDYGEQRLIGLGQLDGVIIAIVYTIRKNKIRIISARKANYDERQSYKEKFGEPDRLG